MELVDVDEELLVSVKLGIEVHFCSSLADETWFSSWNLSCMFYYFVISNKEDINNLLNIQIQTPFSRRLQEYSRFLHI